MVHLIINFIQQLFQVI